MNDAELAADLVERAGALLLDVRGAGPVDQNVLGKLGDQRANRFLMEEIRRERPDDGILSEESRCDGARLTKSRVWIVDPVDGTREYSEGRTDWAVHVALSVDGEAKVGAVALPGLGLVLRSDIVSMAAAPERPVRMVVSRTRPAAEALWVAEALNAELLSMGSAGAKAMAIVRGEADIYLHSGGQFEWDSAAPAAVAASHGLHCSRIDGSPLRYNRPDPYLPDLLVCRRELAGAVITALRAVPIPPVSSLLR